MPTLRKELSDCVFYLYARNPKTGKRSGPHGTGVIVSRHTRNVEKNPLSDERPEQPDELVHYYGVTNWHLAQKAGASIIRLNSRDGGSRFLDFDPLDWQFIATGDDLSAIDLTDELNFDADEVAAYSEYSFVTKEVIDRYRICLGDDTFMIGMFASHHGGKRNHPVARFGNIAGLANLDAPVRQPNKNERPSHLVDMRSRTGFSGSPVSIWRVPANWALERTSWNRPLLKEDLTFDRRKIRVAGMDWFTGLLGVHCGQFWDQARVRKSPPTLTRFEDNEADVIREGDRLYIQSGMTIVVPAWAISELLDLEAFETARKRRDVGRIVAWMRATSGHAVTNNLTP